MAGLVGGLLVWAADADQKESCWGWGEESAEEAFGPLIAGYGRYEFGFPALAQLHCCSLLHPGGSGPR